MARNFTSTDVATDSTFSAPSAISICVWFKSTSGTTARIATTAATTKFDLRYNNATSVNRIEFTRDFSTTDSEWRILSADLGSVASWRHLAVTHDGSTGAPTFYLDGQPVTTTTQTAPSGTIQTGAITLYVGNRPAGDRPLGGAMAYLSIHNVVLTQTEVQQHYATGYTPRGILRSYPLWGDSSEPDLSGNVGNLTVTGTTVVTGPPTSGRIFPFAQSFVPIAAAADLTISPVGIASAEAFGSPTVTGEGTLSPTGIASAEAFGSPTVTGAGTISPVGIASSEAFGAPTVSGAAAPTVLPINPGSVLLFVGNGYELRLASPGGRDLAVLDTFHRAEWVRTQNQVGALTLELPGDIPPDWLAQDGIIRVYRGVGGTLTLEGDTFWLIDDADYDAISRTWSVSAQDTTSILARRIVDYIAGSSQASKSGAADDVLKEIVRENFGSSAGSATGRNVSSVLSVDSDTSAGPTIEKAFAWRKVLDVLQDIANASTLAGTWLGFDLVAQGAGAGTAFRTWTGQRGLDRRSGSAQTLPLGPEYGNLAPASIGYRRRGRVNAVTAGGQGEGALRSLARAEDAAQIGLSPYGRIEDFANASSNASSTAVADAADSALREGRTRIVVSGELKETEATIWGATIGYGDIVPVLVAGTLTDCRIDSYRIALSSNGQRETVGVSLRSL